MHRDQDGVYLTGQNDHSHHGQKKREDLPDALPGEPAGASPTDKLSP